MKIIKQKDIIGVVFKSKDTWFNWCQAAERNGYFFQKAAPGKEAMIQLEAIPNKYQELILQKCPNAIIEYGNNPINNANIAENSTINTNTIPDELHSNPIIKYFEWDNKARAYYSNYELNEEPYRLTLEQIENYTLEASLLNTIQIALTDYDNTLRSTYDILAKYLKESNEWLFVKYKVIHSLPASSKRLQELIKKYELNKYESLVDKRIVNKNRQKINPKIEALLLNIYAGMGYKPNCSDVHKEYIRFLKGEIQVYNKETGELFNNQDEELKHLSYVTIWRCLTKWSVKAPALFKRSRDRQKYISKFIPYTKTFTEYAGSILSVDDFQPNFKYEKGTGKRLWFYVAADVASQAIVSYVYGESKEGIIEDFYRQLIRDYYQYQLPFPYEVECESNLNSQLTEGLLKEGVIFQKVKIYKNIARSKYIERIIGQFKQEYLSKEERFIYRPHAKSENWQGGEGDTNRLMSKDEIISFTIQCIKEWNNAPHPKYPDITRWEYFLQKQHPHLKNIPINYSSILYYAGYETKSSMRLGRIQLLRKNYLVGNSGEILTGNKLLKILEQAEDKEVIVKWLDKNDGSILKAYAYQNDKMICELVDELIIHRSTLEQTDEDKEKIQLMARYKNTIEGYIRRKSQEIQHIAILKNNTQNETALIDTEPEILPPMEDINNDSFFIENKEPLNHKTDLWTRFTS